MTSRTVQSDDARRKLRELLNAVEHDGEHITILRYDTPAAVMVPVDPNPLDARILAMAAILRENGSDEAADQIEGAAAFMREALRGSDDYDIAEALDVIADAARDLAVLARKRPSAARKADMDARSEDERQASR